MVCYGEEFLEWMKGVALYPCNHGLRYVHMIEQCSMNTAGQAYFSCFIGSVKWLFIFWLAPLCWARHAPTKLVYWNGCLLSSGHYQSINVNYIINILNQNKTQWTQQILAVSASAWTSHGHGSECHSFVTDIRRYIKMLKHHQGIFHFNCPSFPLFLFLLRISLSSSP